jgi:F0F1-type ATP synthase membrane subunit b/b'
MLGNYAEMYREIISAIAEELAQDPMRVVAEVIQFVVLLAIVWVVAIGFGKRRGFVANMLTERRAAVAGRVESGSHADERLASAHREATATTRAGRAAARELVARAKKECVEIEATARAETDADCARIQERAEAALATEREEMALELRERLVDLVSSATRSIMNEKLSVAEQRALIESAIAGSVAAGSAGDDGPLRSAVKGA